MVGQDFNPIGESWVASLFHLFYFSLRKELNRGHFILLNNKLAPVIIRGPVMLSFPPFTQTQRLMVPALIVLPVLNTLRRGNARLMRSAVVVDLIG